MTDGPNAANGETQEQMKRLSAAIIEGNADMAREAATSLKAGALEAMEVVNGAIKPAMDEVGARYEKLEVFLPELVLAGEAAQEALKVLLTKEGREAMSKGKIVIGTIYGDIHDIGKNITAAILGANGYEIVDVGNDATPDKFVDTAKKENANIIGMSCLLTPSMYFMRDVVRRLKDEGIRDKIRVIVGGAAIYPGWAKEIEADGWAKDAERAVQLCDALLKQEEKLTAPLIIGEWR